MFWFAPSLSVSDLRCSRSSRTALAAQRRQSTTQWQSSLQLYPCLALASSVPVSPAASSPAARSSARALRSEPGLPQAVSSHWAQVPSVQPRPAVHHLPAAQQQRSEEHTSELQSLMRISYAVFCLKKKNNTQNDK